jgi:hypothetical protein
VNTEETDKEAQDLCLAFDDDLDSEVDDFAIEEADHVRGHPSISLLPLSSLTLHLFICIPPPHLCTIVKDHT